jgi:REase_DpnII-MboI
LPGRRGKFKKSIKSLILYRNFVPVKLYLHAGACRGSRGKFVICNSGFAPWSSKQTQNNFRARKCSPMPVPPGAGTECPDFKMFLLVQGGKLQRFHLQTKSMLTKNQALEKLQRQIAEIDQVVRLRRGSPEFKRWHRNTEVTIENVFGHDTRHIKDFTSLHYSLSAFSSSTPDQAFQEAYQRGLENARQVLRSMIEEIEEYWSEEPASRAHALNAIDAVELLCNRFHLSARQLRQRHADRPTLDVADEYDVQDLLHALLHLYFDDIRAEEWTPSYAGGSARVDFLLKNESIIVEVKRTRQRLGAREIGDELLIDVGRYQAHPDCGTLLCFVYDPEGRIANPRGLEADLSKRVNDMEVKVLIRPTGA